MRSEPATGGTRLFDLAGRVAVVTGGNGGLGLAMASALGAAGAAVVIAARDSGKAETALKLLREEGMESSFVPLDVASTQSCEDLIGEVLQDHGRIDILVNNAGMSVRKLPQELEEEDWDEVIDTNLKSVFRCSRAAFPAMRDQGGGKIVNVGSMYSLFGAPKAAAYGASKGGVVQLSRSLAAAWGEHNIQVNTLLPGWIDTDLTRAAREEVEGLEASVVARTPSGRWGRPEDIAGATLFLASRASDFVTGAVIPVDGGYSSHV
jgi:2-deoxy-D-gluconate 3-dehydrogenase